MSVGLLRHESVLREVLHQPPEQTRTKIYQLTFHYLQSPSHRIRSLQRMDDRLTKKSKEALGHNGID
jgi:predicted nuclease of restriction endonuclease-like RecB superfamily